MYKQASYTKYQKKVIKFLSDTLGVDIPYTYERAQNNHLKVLIDGVHRPLFTGSTPSDAKAINNFMAEVKREVAQRYQQQTENEDDLKTPLTTPNHNGLDKIIQTCLKSLRTRIDAMKAQEEKAVLASNSFEGIKEHRLSEIKSTITWVKNAQKMTFYFKSKEIKTLEQKILEHLDFWMPSTAYYADLLGNKKSNSIPSLEETAEMDNKDDVDKKAEIKQVSASEVMLKKEVKITKPAKVRLDLSAELMKLSSNKRIDLFRKLSRNDALLLIDEINQAISINREQDILQIITMINEKGLQIEDIVEKISQ